MAKKRLFVIEDDKILAKVVTKKFKLEGFDVVLSTDGYEALADVVKANPDVILLDILMPRMDGFEFLHALKEQEKYKDVPVVIYSNLTQQADIDRGMSLGAAAYIEKSGVSIDELVEKVKKVIGAN